MSIETSKKYEVLSGVTTSGVYEIKSLPEESYETILLMIYAKTSPSGTIKVRQTYLEGVDLTSATSETNMWFLSSVSDQSEASAVGGSTGLSISAEGTYCLEINTSFYGDMAVDLTVVSGEFKVVAIGKVKF